jgi:hypothetical protein
VLGFCKISSQELFAWVGLKPYSPWSASWVASFTGTSYWHLATFPICGCTIIDCVSWHSVTLMRHEIINL